MLLFGGRADIHLVLIADSTLAGHGLWGLASAFTRDGWRYAADYWLTFLYDARSRHVCGEISLLRDGTARRARFDISDEASDGRAQRRRVRSWWR